MANKIQFRRGNAADRPTLDVAEPGYDLDTNDLWLGTPAGNVKIYPPAALGSIGLSGSPLAGQVAVFDSPTDATGYADLTWDPVAATLGVDGYISLTHQAASPTGSLGAGQLFVKAADAHLYFMDELGNETDLLAFGGGRLLVEPDPLTVSDVDDYALFVRQTLNDPTVEPGTQTMTLIKGDISVVSQAGWDFVNLMDLQVDGVSEFLVTSTGALTLSSNIFSGGSLFAGSGALRYIGWQSKSSMQSPVDGDITLSNDAGGDFGLLQFGGTTSSYPALRRAGNTLSVVLADNSSSADLFVRNLFATSSVGVGAAAGSGRLYFQNIGDTYSALYFNSALNQVLLHTGSAHGNQLVIGSSLYRDSDFDHLTTTHPTLYLHSATDPDLDNTQYGALYHDGIDFNILSGTGNVLIDSPALFNDDILLNTSSRIVFDTDFDSNTYISKEGTDGYLYFTMNGSLTLQMTSTRTIFLNLNGPEFATGYRVGTNQPGTFQDGAKLYFGNGLHYWQTYNTFTTAYEFWASDVDGLGADGMIWSIQNGTEDVVFEGGVSLKDLKRLSFDGQAGSDTGFYGASANAEFRIQHNGVLWGYWNLSNGLNAADGKRIAFGGTGAAPDYWHVYNATGAAYEFHSADVGGAVPGVVWSVDDGTDDVVFGGNIAISTGGRIVLDADLGADNYIRSAAGGVASVVIDGTTILDLRAIGAGVPTNIAFRFGSSTLSDYVFQRTGSQFEFISSDIDGLGTDGFIFTVADGTDNVTFHGGITMDYVSNPTDAQIQLNKNNLLIDGTGNTSINSANTTGIIRFIASAFTCAQFRSTAFELNVPIDMGDAAVLFGGNFLSPLYWWQYNGSSALQLVSTNVDGLGADGVVMSVTDGTQDVRFFGEVVSSVFSSSTADPASAGIVRLAWGEAIYWRNTINTDNIGLTINTSNRITCTGGFQASAVWIDLGSRLTWPNGLNIRSFVDGELRINNYLDTLGVTFNVNTADTLRILNATATGAGNVGLNTTGRLILDANGAATTYFTAPTAGAMSLYVGGTFVAAATPSFFQILGDRRLYRGVAYWDLHNTVGSAYEFWTTNSDGLGADAIVYSIADGTLTVAFEGDLALGIGQSIYLDDDQDTYVQANADDSFQVVVGGGNVLLLSNSSNSYKNETGRHLLGDINGGNILYAVSPTVNQALLAVDLDAGNQLVVCDYTVASAQKDFDHPAPTNPTVFIHSAADPDTDNTQWGSLSHNGTYFDIVASGGKLRLSGASGTNNEALVIDFETTSNRVSFGSTSGVTSYQFESNLRTNGSFDLSSNGAIQWDGRTQLAALVDGNLLVRDSGFTDFGLLQFGGTTSSYPALQRSTTALLTRLADDSGPAILRSLSEVEINTAGTGTPNALTADETQKIFTNEGATALNAHELPGAAPGITYTFVVQDADGIQVRAAAGDTIRIGANESATNGTISSTTVGEAVILVAINTTQWIAVSVVNASNWTVT